MYLLLSPPSPPHPLFPNSRFPLQPSRQSLNNLMLWLLGKPFEDMKWLVIRWYCLWVTERGNRSKLGSACCCLIRGIESRYFTHKI
ncbi:hypothetical protein I7I48_02877 [Histoplasma ohiense]|nr:hypothetical protein I7I48_02877 [Histoplasma ohiense (nom. inval.)]